MAFSQFDRVPNHYAGPIIQKVKDFRLRSGTRSESPTRLDIGQLQVLVPRHFGFCFGVERAIHMAFSTLEKHPDQRTYLVSEIIHNPLVNRDLEERGIRFIFDDTGARKVPEGGIGPDDIVLIPAFGTTLENEEFLRRSGVDTATDEFRDNCDTTCPFVSKVWNRGEQLGREGYTIVIHGKFGHEETQATHSHTMQYGRTLVVLDEAEARKIHDFIVGTLDAAQFRRSFAGKWSPGFDPETDLERVAVVNQTTMLAEETTRVAALLRDAMRIRYGEADLDHHFADTNDTLCYATNQNQDATKALLRAGPDLALIVGGYNSSNTSHLVEICSAVMPSYLIAGADELLARDRVRHYDIGTREITFSDHWLPDRLPARIAVTSGASCPDVLMNQVVVRIAGFYGYGAAEIEAGLDELSLFEPVAVAS